MNPHLQKEVRGAGWGIFWWTLAVVLHVLVVAVIIYFEPLRTWYLSRSDAEANLELIEGDRMKEILRQMMEVHTKRIREKVVEERKLLADLENMRDSRFNTYVKHAGNKAESLSTLGDTGPNVNQALDSLDVFQLYELAQKIEKKSYETYRHMRIVELSRIQGLTFEAAADVTNVAVPAHPEINRAPFGAVIKKATDPNFVAMKNELQTIHAEISAMISGIVRMIDVGRGLMGEDVGGITVVGAGGIFEGGGGGRWGSNIGPTLSPDEFFAGNRSGDFSEDWKPSFGRKLTDQGIKAEWMYLDTWYIIGPFPNPNRQYMDKVFPPESVVDLDATYVGKDGRKLTWQWLQNRPGGIMIAPHVATSYAVWYAFTEVYSDKNQTKWVSFGSDDYSKAWLNGEPVWTSGKTPHMWIPDRGFRKLNFRKGHNQLLLKLENAGGTTGFSVVIYTGDIGEMSAAPAAEKTASP